MTRPSLAQQAGVPDVPRVSWSGPPQRWTVHAADDTGLVVSLRPDGTVERGDGDVLARAAQLQPEWASQLALALLRADGRHRRTLLLLWWTWACGAVVVLSWVLAS